MTEIELPQLLIELLTEIKNDGESECLERKISDTRFFGEYVSAISNGDCLQNKDFGYLIFGVNEKNEIVGTEIKRGELERAGIKTKIQPKIDYTCHNIVDQNRSIILVKIPAAKGEPTLYNGKSYVRIGEDKTSLSNLSPEQIKKIYNSTTDWSAQTSDTATIDDLDEVALKKAREKFKERRENSRFLKEIDGWDNKTFLNKSEVLINGKITNAALLLLGKRESRNHLKNHNVAEITWGLETIEEKAYEHFYPPFLLSTSEIWQRIRNTKYKLFPAHELLAREVNKYDEETVLEALYNCIAHQDYFLNCRIILTEKADRLVFISAGSFFEGKAEDYATGKKIAQKYRNQFLVNAMVNLGMIDKRGYGINKMFVGQKNKFFPLPDYHKSTKESVVLEIYGRIIDEKFSQILMEKTDLDLQTIIALDKVQKKTLPTDEEAKLLKKQKLMGGRKPNYFLSAEIAKLANQKERHIRNRAFDDQYYKDMILKYLNTYNEGSRENIDELLLGKLSEALSQEQRKRKINNLLNAMRANGLIRNHGTNRNPIWRIVQNFS